MKTTARRRSVGQIIWVGFVVLLLLLAGIAAVSHFALRLSQARLAGLAEEAVAKTTIAAEMERTLAAARYDVTVSSFAHHGTGFDEAERRLAQFERQLRRARALAAEGEQPAFGAAVRELELAFPGYKAEAAQLRELRGTISGSRDRASASFEKLTGILSKYAAGSDSDALLDLVLLQQVSAIRVNTLQAFVDRDTARAGKSLEQLKGFKRQTAENAEIAQAFDALVADLTTAVTLFDRFEAAYAAWSATGAVMLQRAVAIGQQTSGEMRDRSFATADQMAMAAIAVTAGMVVALGFGLMTAARVARRVRLELAEVAERMEATAEELAHDAGRLTHASTGLSEQASAQAASLQQTRASVAELGEMTRKNETVARQVATAMRETAETARRGMGEMAAMKTAVEEINHSSGEITAIVKTIDEIAFQTNILALNAAVEAARAREAGAGFAVVADEVRSLAQKSATAARMTADKVSISTEKTRRGVEHAARAAAAFDEVAGQATGLASRAAEIAVVSEHQRAGLDQIVTATDALDRVSQSNAAQAQETAGAAASLEQHVQTVVTTMRGLRGARVRQAAHPANAGASPAAAVAGPARRVQQEELTAVARM